LFIQYSELIDSAFGNQQGSGTRGVVLIRRPVITTVWFGMHAVGQQIEGGSPMSIFMILFLVLLVAWLLGLSVFHVAGGFIHILLIVAVISLIVHFVRGRTTSA
jgi:uncharacterized protein DUF5670